MTANEDPACSWFERVSAMIDGELEESQAPMVRLHASLCEKCAPLLGARITAIPRLGSTEFPAPPFQPSLPFRIVAVIAGVAIVVGSIPGFIRGNTNGDALHDLRHLSIWQVAIGVAVTTVGLTIRFSRLILVMVGVFLVLTGIAVIYDLATGHRGPWTDWSHVVEVVAALVLAQCARPYARRYLRRAT